MAYQPVYLLPGGSDESPAVIFDKMSFEPVFGLGYVIHPGDVKLPLSSGVTAIPFADL